MYPIPQIRGYYSWAKANESWTSRTYSQNGEELVAGGDARMSSYRKSRK